MANMTNILNVVPSECRPTGFLPTARPPSSIPQLNEQFILKQSHLLGHLIEKMLVLWKRASHLSRKCNFLEMACESTFIG